MRKFIILIMSMLILSSFIFLNNLLADKVYKIEGEISLLTGEHNVYVGLFKKEYWDYDTNKPFYAKMYKPSEIVSGKVRYTFTVNQKGYYAVSIFEDTDDNQKLSSGLFGPNEPYGFYKYFKPKLSKPDFDDIKFYVDEDLINCNIRLLNTD